MTTPSKHMTFDYEDKLKEKEFKDAINTVSNFCIRNGIPFFLSMAVKNTEEKTEYKNYYNFPQTINGGLELADNKFNDYILVYRGAKANTLDSLQEFTEEEEKYIQDMDAFSKKVTDSLAVEYI